MDDSSPSFFFSTICFFTRFKNLAWTLLPDARFAILCNFLNFWLCLSLVLSALAIEGGAKEAGASSLASAGLSAPPAPDTGAGGASKVDLPDTPGATPDAACIVCQHRFFKSCVWCSIGSQPRFN